MQRMKKVSDPDLSEFIVVTWLLAVLMVAVTPLCGPLLERGAWPFRHLDIAFGILGFGIAFGLPALVASLNVLPFLARRCRSLLAYVLWYFSIIIILALTLLPFTGPFDLFLGPMGLLAAGAIFLALALRLPAFEKLLKKIET
jgi:hypothetical protein